MARVSRSAPILTVSVAAEMAGMHAQTLRQYDRLGLVVAKRTRGGGRRYSLNDVDRLTEIQRLSHDEGINLAGIARILELEDKVEKLTKANTKLNRENEAIGAAGRILADKLDRLDARRSRVFAASSTGDVTMAERFDLLREALRRQSEGADDDAGNGVVVWRPRAVTRYVEDE